MTSDTPLTPAVLVANANEHLASLRKRLYPILSQWDRHNLSKDENVYGFFLLDRLKEELEELQNQVGKEETPVQG